MDIREFIIHKNIFNVQTTTPVFPVQPVTGITTLVSGTVTVADTTITAAPKIFLTPQGGTLNVGTVWVSARVNNTSFTITSANVLDARVVAYQIYA